MKISDLIIVLQNRMQKHGDIDVEITWEGITNPVTTDSIYKSKSGDLYIDADNNSYKHKFATDKTEGEDGA